VGYNGGQDDGKSNKRVKAPSNAQRHHRQILCHFEESCKRQKQMAEEFVIHLPLPAEDQREQIKRQKYMQSCSALTVYSLCTELLSMLAT